MPLASLTEPFVAIQEEFVSIDETRDETDQNVQELEINVEKCALNSEKVIPLFFDLLSVIGQGSFGKVFLVRKNTGSDKGTLYAMKVLKKAVLKVRDRERTKMERDILTRIKHPFIVNLHYAFQTEGKVYLVLEFLRGGDLFTRLTKEYMFTEEDVKFYLAEIALALDYLHGCGIVYRDLKPENVLLSSDGHIRLTDFGLSKESINEISGDRAYSFCGTVEYMAPEVILRKGHGTAADWWSLGVLMYEMLTGFLPFRSDDRKETMNMIVSSKLSMPRFLSFDAQNLLRALFKRTPNNRLGFGPEGFEQVKNHNFFATINWDDLLACKIQPPFKPPCCSLEVMNNFDQEFTSQTPYDSPCPLPSASAHALFHGFSYVAPSLFNDVEPVISNSPVNIILRSPEEYDEAQNADSCTPLSNNGVSFPKLRGISGIKTKSFLSDYALLKEIAKSDFSTIHKCITLATNNIYYVKIIDKTKKDCSEEVEILLRHHHHPNIVNIQDIYENENSVFLIMEYFKGGILLDKIHSNTHLSERDVSGVISSIASTIQYLHNNMVVHLDLKPSNIMYADDGKSTNSIKICDFGFAKQLRAENGLLMTPSYTASYIAPEVLKLHSYQAACDVWSLGVYTFVLLFWCTPYSLRSIDSPDIILAQIESGKLGADDYWATVSCMAKELLTGILHPDPYKRYTIDMILQHPWITQPNTLSSDMLVRFPNRDLREIKDSIDAIYEALNKITTPTLKSVNASTIAQRRRNSKPVLTGQ